MDVSNMTNSYVMNEDFLHYLWKHKKFNLLNLRTAQDVPVEILKTGQHNQLAGPDFFNAYLRIDGQKWAGNVELHHKASEWYAHGHERDPGYDNVILHVVWENDMPIFGKDNTLLPTLILKNHIDPSLIKGYKKLFDHPHTGFNNCEQDFGNVPLHIIQNWLERLYLERLERKVAQIDSLLRESHNDWEAILFKMLARSFGTKINGDAFMAMADQLPFKVLRKIANTPGSLEAVFLGIAGLMPQDAQGSSEREIVEWKKEYEFLTSKYDLKRSPFNVQFFRLRPVNFPTIRLSQLAALYQRENQLFAKLIKMDTLAGFYKLLAVNASGYWDTHYNFGKAQPKRVKKLSRGFIDLLLINTIIPVIFAYNKSRNNTDQERILQLISQIKTEKNKITDKFHTMHTMPKNALISQGLLQLKNEYCDKNRCLKCRVGNYLIDTPVV